MVHGYDAVVYHVAILARSNVVFVIACKNWIDGKTLGSYALFVITIGLADH